MIIGWADAEADSEISRNADEAEAVMNEVIREVLGPDATMGRDLFYGHYLLKWTNPNLGNATETKKPEMEVYLFGSAHTTLEDMLWEAHLGFYDASNLEKDYQGNTPLAIALTQAGKGILDYLNEHVYTDV